ncbi:MAG: tyrosine-type recombinase/integrase [Candidatus Sulfotelmatobacter sp.]
MKRQRRQTGRIYLASGNWYVQYYEARDGSRKRVSHMLHAKDKQHAKANSKPLVDLKDAFMLEVNKGTQEPSTSMGVIEFWDDIYLPHVEKNKRTSTVRGYKAIWDQHLKDHFTGYALGEYRTHYGTGLLNGLTASLSRRSLQHVRSLASGLFSHAVNLGYLAVNPWREVRVTENIREPEPTDHYTLAEAEDVMKALKGKLEAQCIFALAFFQALRPSEIAGLKWEDISDGWLTIERAVVRGVIGDTKTSGSKGRVPLIRVVTGLLEMWRERRGNPESGWVFQDRRGDPRDMNEYARRVIKPAVPGWKGLYSARRGCATALVELTGDVLAAQGMLRHASMATLFEHYKRNTPDATVAGMKLLAKAAKKALNK